ncbi:hypothetical protein BGZ94_000893, partial [Podila epigama]
NNLRFIHVQNNGKEVVEPSSFEGSGPDEDRSFLDLKAHWEAQCALGQDAVADVQIRSQYLRSLDPNAIDIDGSDGEVDDGAPGGSGGEPCPGGTPGPVNTQASTSAESKKKRGPRGAYRNYTRGQIQDLLGLIFDKGTKCSKAADAVGIKKRTASSIIAQESPISQKKRGPPKKLDDLHTAFLKMSLDEDPIYGCFRC